MKFNHSRYYSILTKYYSIFFLKLFFFLGVHIFFTFKNLGRNGRIFMLWQKSKHDLKACHSLTWTTRFFSLLSTCCEYNTCLIDLQWSWTWVCHWWTVYNFGWRHGTACPWPAVWCHSPSPVGGSPLLDSSQTETESPTNTTDNDPSNWDGIYYMYNHKAVMLQ